MSEEFFADEFVRFNLAMPPASKGHMQVLPAKQATSFEDLSETEFVELFYGASYAATALFELLGAHGTNIICSDFGDGVNIDVVARSEEDNLNFLWQATQANPAELDEVSKHIKDALDEELWAKNNPQDAAKLSQKSAPSAPKELEHKDGRVNYLLKSLRRTP